MLELRDVRKHFETPSGEIVRAVDGVTLSVARGELVALYGPSGSGKTTLLKLIAGLEAPDSGTVAVGGRDVAALSKHLRADYRLREVGFIRQSPTFIPGASALDNAALKLLGDMPKRQARRHVEPLLARLGLAERLSHRPEQLSGGEQQRISIARALANRPAVLLADEPTGSLDSKRSADVLMLLRSLCRDEQVAVLLVTHDARAAHHADRALELSDGRLRAYAAEERAGA